MNLIGYYCTARLYQALRYSMLDFKSSYKQLLHNCGKSTLFLQRLQKLMEVIYRILNGLYPSCHLVSSSRVRLLVIAIIIFLQASRSLAEPHSSVSVHYVTALMSSSQRARGLPQPILLTFPNYFLFA